MCEKIRIVKSDDKSRAMIFSEGKLVGAVNLEDLEKFVKDEKLNLIDCKWTKGDLENAK